MANNNVECGITVHTRRESKVMVWSGGLACLSCHYYYMKERAKEKKTHFYEHPMTFTTFTFLRSNGAISAQPIYYDFV
jgi:hypothetical protein